MFCKKCGKEIDDNAKFCESCGQKVEADIYLQIKSEPKTNKLKLVLKTITIIFLTFIMLSSIVYLLIPEEDVHKLDPRQCDSNYVNILLKNIYLNNTNISKAVIFNDDIEFSSFSEISNNKNFRNCSAKVTYGLNNYIYLLSGYNKLRCDISYVVKTPDLLHISVEPDFYNNFEIIKNCVPLNINENIKKEEKEEKEENKNLKEQMEEYLEMTHSETNVNPEDEEENIRMQIDKRLRMIQNEEEISEAENKTYKTGICYNGYTSLGEDAKACILLSTADLENSFVQNLEYKEVIIDKMDFYNDGLKLNNNFVIPEINISVSEIFGKEEINGNETLLFIPALIDASWLNKGLKIGSVLRPKNLNRMNSGDNGIRYYIIGYLENGNKDSLYHFSDDISPMSSYGSCGRECHHDSYEQIVYGLK